MYIKDVHTMRLLIIEIKRLLNLTKLLEKLLNVTPPAHPDHPLLTTALTQYNQVCAYVAVCAVVQCVHMILCVCLSMHMRECNIVYANNTASKWRISFHCVYPF